MRNYCHNQHTHLYRSCYSKRPLELVSFSTDISEHSKTSHWVQEDICNLELETVLPNRSLQTVAGKLKCFYQSRSLKRQWRLHFKKWWKNIRIKVGITLTENLPNNCMRSLYKVHLFPVWNGQIQVAECSTRSDHLPPTSCPVPIAPSGVPWKFPERPGNLYPTAGANLASYNAGTKSWGASSLRSISAH